MRKLLGTLLLAFFALSGCAMPGAFEPGMPAASADRGSIFVVRHLQKAEGDDPPLNQEGTAAALRLADMLADENVSAIFATPTRRAMQTADPLARRLGIPVTAYDPRMPDSLVTAVSASPGAVLVVGHSNTVPDLIARFGGQPVPQLTEQDYGTVYAIDAKGKVRPLDIE